jgi:hypothetical protein
MKPCPREGEVQAILRQGHWPEACDPEFRSHVQTCHTCNDQLLVLHAFHAARAQAMQAAGVDHPNLLWWRRIHLRRSVDRPSLSPCSRAADHTFRELRSALRSKGSSKRRLKVFLNLKSSKIFH